LNQHQFLVSAIVSVYNSGRFIRGLLEDLIAQSLYKKNLLEIIVVDTASEHDEASVVRHYQQRYKNISYIRTEDRKTVYAAWNIGIKHSSGKYITNANTDDRHSPIALERLAMTLEAMPDVALVYADVYVTERPNEVFEDADPSKRYYWYDWDRQTLLDKGCFIGPQPMWRRSVHEEYGYFDESLVVSGDAEFWLRISQTNKFYHIREPLGLYLKRPDSIEHSNQQRRDYENLKIITAYREAYKKGQIIRVRPQGGIMDSISDMVSIILVASERQRFEAMEEMVRAYTQTNYEIIRVDVNNNGLARALNKALGSCHGQHIAIVEESMILTDGAIDNLIGHLYPKVFAVCPVTNLKIFQNKEPYKDMDRLRLFARSYRERNLGRTIKSRSALASCFVFDQATISVVGTFDEGLKGLLSLVDDLSLRATLKGYEILIAGDVYAHCSRPMARDPQALLLAKWSNIDPSSDTGKRLLSLDGIEEAQRLFQQGNLDRAVKRLFDYINLLPDNKEITRCLLEILQHGAKYEDVVRITSMLNLVDHEIELLRCSALIATGKTEEAERLLSHNNSPEAMNLIGLIKLQRGNENEAEQLFTMALEKRPNLAEAHKNLGLFQYSRGNKTSGFKHIERAFILEPFNPKYVETYHLLVSSEGLYSRGELAYSEAIEVYPHCKQPLLFLIDCLLKQDKYEEAMAAIERLIVNFPYNEQTLEAALKVRDRIGPLDTTNRDNSLSLCMIVRDEEANLPTCLASIKPVVDEIIIVDTGSSDNTKTIASIFGAKLYDYQWDDDFAAARNYSIKKAKGKWILIMDADEVLSKRELYYLKDCLSTKSYAYQVITRNYTFQSDTLGFIENDGSYGEERGIGWIPTLKVRLFPNIREASFDGKVHEMVDLSLKRAGIEIKTAPFMIHHYGKLDVEKDRLKAEKYYRLGKEKLASSPEDLKALKELAIVSGGLGKYEEAIELWHQVLRKEPDNVDALLNLWGIMFKQNEHAKAREYLKRVLAIEPNNPVALARLNVTGD
jgi:glycosyltransferase involved in cell wall biosynthesis/Tfp pilus assembly protein PilF